MHPMPDTNGSTLPRNSVVSTYTELIAEVRQSGLLERRRGFYVRRVALCVAAFVGVWAAVVVIGDSWWQLLPAVALAVVSTQIGFLGHDGAHRQMFSSAAANEWTARIVAGAFAGLSLHWWRAKHNRHHKAPNKIGVDPDIESGPLAFVPADATDRTGFYRWFTRRQGWLFFPLVTLEGVALHAHSVRGLLGTTPVAHRSVELGLITARLLFGVVVPVMVMSPPIAITFIVTHLALFGVLLGCSFAPNHKGMPLVPRNMKVDFLHRQVVMSRNIRGGRFLDFMMGGLNYQIEHHLFPSMPRPHLAKVQPLVRAHCLRHGVPYTETSLIASYGIVIRYLNQAGLGERDPFTCPLVRMYR